MVTVGTCEPFPVSLTYPTLVVFDPLSYESIRYFGLNKFPFAPSAAFRTP
jgi:hypothetical protein